MVPPEPPDNGTPEVSPSMSLLRAELRAGRVSRVRSELARLPLDQLSVAPICEIYAEVLWRLRDLDALTELIQKLRTTRTDPSALALAALYSSKTARSRGEYREALEIITPVINTSEGVTAEVRGSLLCEAGFCWFRLREFVAARTALSRALGVLETSGKSELVAQALFHLALVEKASLDWDRADALNAEAAELCSNSGLAKQLLAATTNQFVVRLFRGHFISAAGLGFKSVALAEELADQWMRVFTLANLGLLHTRRREFREARTRLTAALRASKEVGVLRGQALTCEYLGELALREGRLPAARRWLRRAYELIESVPERDIMGEARCRLAEVELQSGNVELAFTLAHETRLEFERMNDLYEINVCKRVEAQVLLTLDRRAEATQLLEEASDFFRRIDERFESHRVKRLLDVAIEGGRVEEVDLINLPQEVEPPTEPSNEADTIHPPDLHLPNTTRPTGDPDFPGLLGQCFEYRKMIQSIRAAARVDTHVLVMGETGTGKEYITRSIHALSRRAAGPFIPYNCGCGGAEMMDAEFFGHRKGSFTGASASRDGLVKTAAGGTLFLDEIAELSVSLQSRLLRMIETGEVRPVGADESESVDVRIISATHQDLARKVTAGSFRMDLYHRLAAVQVCVPPLRDRLDDLEILVEHFARQVRLRGCEGFAGVSDRVLAAMRVYSWPGNVRELRNVVFELASRTTAGKKATDWAPPDAEARALLRRPQTHIERSVIEDELRGAGGNVTVVIEKLSLSRARFYRLCQRYGIDINAYR